MAGKKRSMAQPSTQQLAELFEYQSLRVYKIPLDRIRPALVNPNHLSAAELEATAASMLKYGMLKPGMVRPFDESDKEDVVQQGLGVWLLLEYLAGVVDPNRRPPSQHAKDQAVAELRARFGAEWPTRYEMIDAHHRLELVQRWVSSGFPSGVTPHPSVVECVSERMLPCTVHPMSAAVAKHLRLILTYDRGRGEELPSGQLAAELLRVMPMQDLLVGLPWTEAVAQQHVDVAQFDWTAHLQRIGDEKAKRDADKAKRKAEQFRITIVGPNSLREEAMRVVTDFLAANPAVKVKQ